MLGGSMFNGNFEGWVKAALMRAVKTAAQSAVALIGTNTIGITDVDWIALVSAAGLAAVVSLLTSVAGLPEVESSDDGSVDYD